ncbi:MAG: ribosomal RNA small subunit methyltransferase A [Phycisphaerae bacterium]|nr:ribosomal RNA small subunit methyltransferase A [Phycisphaerae bacterium]
MSHTIQQIQDLLAGAGISPRHQWGQNFLIDINLMHLLINTADLMGKETILEVGTGTGSLTDLLAEKAGFVVTVDIDRGLSMIACNELAHHTNVKHINTDILASKSLLAPEVTDCLKAEHKKLNGPFYLMANLPYNISSPLIINLLLNYMPDKIVVTVQAEVGHRMASEPGCKQYGMLGILLQALGSVKYIRTIKPGSFWPSPKIDSAIISWELDQEKLAKIKNIAKLKQTIDIALGHRRKTINSCLKPQENKTLMVEKLNELGIDTKRRGETLSPEEFVALANAWDEFLTSKKVNK